MKRRASLAAAIDPLAVVEEQLGNIETWPTSVITDMLSSECYEEGCSIFVRERS